MKQLPGAGGPDLSQCVCVFYNQIDAFISIIMAQSRT